MMNYSSWMYWFSSLNPVDIIVGSAFGSVLGLLVTIIHARETERIKSAKLRARFYPIAGQFACYFNEDEHLTDRIISQANIMYEADNKLTIEVTTLINAA